jgi:hypothetical protein
MTALGIQVGDARWRFTPDVPGPNAAQRSQMLLRMQLIDEVENRPPTAVMTATTALAGALAKVATSGLAGLAGRPALMFHAPAIAATRLTMAVAGTGYLPLAIDVPLGPQPGYPDAFAPADLGQVALHRLPSRIVGRVASRTTGSLTGATIALSAVWPVLRQPVPPGQAVNLMPSFVGLYADRPLAATIRRRNLALAGQPKTLERPIGVGGTVVRLSDGIGLAAGQILAIDPAGEGRLEFVGIASLGPVSGPDAAVDVTLDLPLRQPHFSGSVVDRAVSGAAGPANPLARAARAGDGSIWANSLAGIGVGTTAVELSGGPAPAEFHASRLYRATSDGFGEFALPPLHRLASVELTVTHPGQPNPIVRIIQMDWNEPRQREDFLFP